VRFAATWGFTRQFVGSVKKEMARKKANLPLASLVCVSTGKAENEPCARIAGRKSCGVKEKKIVRVLL